MEAHGTVQVRPNHVIDIPSLARYLSSDAYPSQFPNPLKPSSLSLSKSKSKTKIRQFSDGQSNPTYLLSSGSDCQVVLRKKPPGKILPSAHAIEREFLIMSALYPTGFPVPQMYHLCEDPSVIGTPFYLMEYVQGRVLSNADEAELARSSPDDVSAMYTELSRVLASLHAIDLNKVGLEGLRRKGKYGVRQFRRWRKQYEASKTGNIPEMDRLMEYFESSKHLSERGEDLQTIVHGDFRLGNVILHPTENRIIAVLDWELTTIGHPFADLSYLCLPFTQLGDSSTSNSINKLQLQMQHRNVVQEYIKKCMQKGLVDIVNSYSEKGDAEWSDSYKFYTVLSYFRLASICQGVFSRSIQGNASSAKAASYGQRAVMLAENGWRIASDSASLVFPDSLYQTLPDGLLPFEQLLSPRFRSCRVKLLRFMDEFVYPNEFVHKLQHSELPSRWQIPHITEVLKAKAQSIGLWNWFLPAFQDTNGNTIGLSNLEYAPLCEIMGRSVTFAPELFNCAAPDTGNMEVLARYGTPQHQREWLQPLLDGTIRSCFAMTEPLVASSDATNIECRIERKGAEYIVNGRKWWTSGAMDPRCKLAIVMGKTSFQGPKHAQQSMILVPMDAPGVTLLRPLSVFGYDDAPHGHAEVLFTDVHVPLSNLLLGEGRGFEIAQGRLGPGRIHHCMRMIGCAERALEMMVARAKQRTAFGKRLLDMGVVRSDIAESRISIEKSRLLTLQAAYMMDTVGNKRARQQIAMIKVSAPRMALEVIDKAIQLYGGAGVCQDFALAHMWAGTRTLRIADGPDDVHLGTVAKEELRKSRL